MWLSVTLLTDAAHAEALADALLARGAISASVEDADAGTGAEMPQFAEPCETTVRMWPRSRVAALVSPETNMAEWVALCAADAELDQAPEYAVEEIPEQDWVELTRSQFQPIRIADELWIVPSWHVPPDPNAVHIVLDPGMAFGTGSHPTTRLCLKWLLSNVHDAMSVLDYGCGSGILAIAAAKLGARRAVGIDIDGQALAAAADNAARNRVKVELLHAEEPLDETFDLVVANILTNPLCALAPLLSARVGSSGRLAVSGVLEDQACVVRDAYLPFITLSVAAVEEGWVVLQGWRL